MFSVLVSGPQFTRYFSSLSLIQLLSSQSVAEASGVCLLSRFLHFLGTGCLLSCLTAATLGSLSSFHPHPLSSAKVIFNRPISDHATSLLKVFQWLNVALRIKAKLFGYSRAKFLSVPPPGVYIHSSLPVFSQVVDTSRFWCSHGIHTTPSEQWPFWWTSVYMPRPLWPHVRSARGRGGGCGIGFVSFLPIVHPVNIYWMNTVWFCLSPAGMLIWL